MGHCVPFPVGVKKVMKWDHAARECTISSFMLINFPFGTTVTVHCTLWPVVSPLPLMAAPHALLIDKLEPVEAQFVIGHCFSSPF